MFDLPTWHLILLLGSLLAGLFIYIVSYTGFQRSLFKVLIVIIPFQLLSSQIYGSLNMGFTYVLGASMLLNQAWIKKRTKENWPLILGFGIIICSFCLSWTQTSRVFWSRTLLYFIMFGSNIVLFYITYHFISDLEDIHTFFRLLFLCNVLVILYCILQLILGFGEFTFLGIKEFSLQKGRIDRLGGPFNAVGITAEYMVIQCLLLAYYLMTMDRYKKGILVLMFCNIAALIGTGNRGGFISFILGFILYIYTYRKRFGPAKALVAGLTMVIILVSASFIMIKYTDFNVLYERILATRMDGITPDTRTGWPYVVEKIFDKPVVGHGPRLVIRSEAHAPPRWPKGEIDFYPHNLYLYILYTLGIVGLLAYGIWGLLYIIRLGKMANKSPSKIDFISGLPQLGIIIFTVFLFDQMKVEFLRSYLLDYQHYLMALFAMFCALRKTISI